MGKKMMSYSCVFIFSMALLLLGIQTLAAATLLNEDFHYRIQHKIAYYPRLTEVINKDVMDLMRQYEVPSLYISDVVTDSEVDYYVKSRTKQKVYLNHEKEDIIKINEELKKLISYTVDRYLYRLEHYEVSFEQEKVDLLKREINEMIFNQITVKSNYFSMNQGMNLLKKFIGNAVSLMSIINFLMLILMSVMGILIVNWKQKKNLLLYGAVGCFITSLCYLVTVKGLKLLYTVDLSEESSIQKELILATANELHNKYTLSAACLIIVGLLLIISFYGLTEWGKIRHIENVEPIT